MSGRKKPMLLKIEEHAHAETRAFSEREIRALKADASALRASNKVLAELVDTQETELNAYASVLLDRPWPKPIKPRVRKKSVSESTVLALASDWHVEEQVEPDTVQGRNKYNPEIADDRAEKFFQRLLSLTEMNRGHTKIKDLILWLGGDFITGSIHDEFKETNAMSPLEAIAFVSGLLKRGIELLMEHGKFERIVIPCSFGNHGRLTKKPYYSRAAHHNLEFFLYAQLCDHFKGAEGVEFNITTSRINESVEVYGRRIRYHHGEDIKYQGGQQGLYGRMYKAHANWNRSSECYMTCIGHWHTAMAFQDLGMTNGSLIGYSAYSQMLQCQYEEPRQMFCLIEKDRGMTMAAPIFVT